MHTAKFISVLKSFSPAEFRKFGLIIRSPYYNSEKVIIKVYDLLKRHYPDFNSNSLEKHKVFAKLYPGKVFNDAMMRNIFSDMLRLCEEFLLAEYNKQKEFGAKLALMNEYSRRRLIKLYEKNLQKAESLLGSERIADINYYRDKLQLEVAKTSYEIMHVDKYVKPKDTRQIISDNITAVFLMDMLHMNLTFLNRQIQIDNKSYRLNFEDEIESFLNNKGRAYLEIPYIKYFFLTYMLLKTKEEKYFFMLKDFTDTDFEKLASEEKRSVITVLTNFCYVMITLGEDKYLNEQFRLFKMMIDKNIYLNAAGKIPSVFFMNMSVIGIESAGIEWVEKFISDKKNELKEDSRDDTLRFCNALVYYYKKDFDHAKKDLAAIVTEDITYKQNVRSLYLKILFDTNDIEPFLSHVDSYKHFIAKNKQVFNRIKEQINNYITYSKRIFCIKNRIGKYDEFDLASLKKEIKACKKLINRPWLLKKIIEIEL